MRQYLIKPNLIEFFYKKQQTLMLLIYKTAKIILVLYWGLGYNRNHIRSMAQYSTKMIFAVLDVSLIMGLNIGETDKVFFH